MPLTFEGPPVLETWNIVVDTKSNVLESKAVEAFFFFLSPSVEDHRILFQKDLY